MNWILKTIILAGLLGAIFFAPLVYAHLKYPPLDRKNIARADAALVFGALVHGDVVSPLHKERLNAAVDLFNRNLVSTIVVSNTQYAAVVMARYLEEMSVPETAIEIDGNAAQTSDTCVNEFARNAPRSVILVSQGFHVPRLSMQCKWEGILGQSLAAEEYRAPGASKLTRLQITQIRMTRHAREAGLLWMALLGLYDNL